MRPLLVAGAVALATIATGTGQAAELVVLAAAGARAAVINADLAAKFEQATGNHVSFTFGTAGGMRDKIVAGEAVDLVILPTVQFDELSKSGFIVAESRNVIGVLRLGLAVPAGAKKPPIATVAEFKQALLDAPSIGIADPASGATSGTYLFKLFQQMGVVDALKDRLKLYSAGALVAFDALSRKEIAFAAGQISEILPIKGVEVVGPLPEEIQLKSIYSAGLAANSAAPDAARALLERLTSPEMASAFKASGIDPR